MAWFRVQTPHDGMGRGLVVELKDTADVKGRVAKGYLKRLPRTEAPNWIQSKKPTVATSGLEVGSTPELGVSNSEVLSETATDTAG